MTSTDRLDYPRFALFAPTLGSAGGYAALNGHLAHYLPQLTVALVRDAEALRAALPGLDADVLVVSGHIDGIRRLRSLLRAGNATHVIAAQNPVLPLVAIDLSLIQNHFLVRPLRAARLHPYPLEWLRLFGGALLTTLQVVRSRDTIVLNSDYPKLWNRAGRIRVVPNRITATHVPSSTMRQPIIAVVSSFYPFRYLHLAITAFRQSGLHASGWRMVVHASNGNAHYERTCRQLVSETPGVEFGPDGPATTTLRTAAMALFPSRLEGSSIAFLEALLLVPLVIALDAPHFRESVGIEGSIGRVHWVDSSAPEAWAVMLQQAASTSSTAATNLPSASSKDDAGAQLQ